ncbi:hypothetical protein BD770DRAFT_449824 [Pilaira anomala]|nr:hypothetical protein BD770DRAFT_449824 [Pilaira anomala]
MSSWLSQITSTVSNIAGLTEEGSVKTPGDSAKDENQIFYMTTKTGGFIFVQLIYSGIGLFKPTVSFTCRFYDPLSKRNKFKNFNQASEFTLSKDRRSVKTEFFNVTLDDASSRFKISITHPELIADLDYVSYR